MTPATLTSMAARSSLTAVRVRERPLNSIPVSFRLVLKTVGGTEDFGLRPLNITAVTSSNEQSIGAEKSPE